MDFIPWCNPNDILSSEDCNKNFTLKEVACELEVEEVGRIIQEFVKCDPSFNTLQWFINNIVAPMIEDKEVDEDEKDEKTRDFVLNHVIRGGGLQFLQQHETYFNVNETSDDDDYLFCQRSHLRTPCQGCSRRGKLFVSTSYILDNPSLMRKTLYYLLDDDEQIILRTMCGVGTAASLGNVEFLQETVKIFNDWDLDANEDVKSLLKVAAKYRQFNVIKFFMDNFSSSLNANALMIYHIALKTWDIEMLNFIHPKYLSLDLIVADARTYAENAPHDPFMCVLSDNSETRMIDDVHEVIDWLYRRDLKPLEPSKFLYEIVRGGYSSIFAVAFNKEGKTSALGRKLFMECALRAKTKHIDKYIDMLNVLHPPSPTINIDWIPQLPLIPQLLDWFWNNNYISATDVSKHLSLFVKKTRFETLKWCLQHLKKSSSQALSEKDHDDLTRAIWSNNWCDENEHHVEIFHYLYKNNLLLFCQEIKEDSQLANEALIHRTISIGFHPALEWMMKDNRLSTQDPNKIQEMAKIAVLAENVDCLCWIYENLYFDRPSPALTSSASSSSSIAHSLLPKPTTRSSTQQQEKHVMKLEHHIYLFRFLRNCLFYQWRYDPTDRLLNLIPVCHAYYDPIYRSLNKKPHFSPRWKK